MKRTRWALLLAGLLALLEPRVARAEDPGDAGDADAGGAAADATPPPADADPPPASCGDLLIVLDRSGSMSACTFPDGDTKEGVARKAIQEIIARYPSLHMGLFVFPDTLGDCAGSACKAGKVVLDVAADGAAAVGSWLSSMPRSCGGTPTGTSLQVVETYTGWTPGKNHYVLLLTDGVPTCQDGDNAGRPCDGKGCEECKNPSKAYDALTHLRDRGIHTFVVGFDTTKATCPAQAKTCGLLSSAKPASIKLNADTLNKMADSGGEPGSGATRYFAADDPASLADALAKILGKVGSGTVGGCAKVGGGGDRGPDAAAGGGDRDGGAQNPGGNGGSPSPHGEPPGCACASAGAGATPAPTGLALVVLTVARRRRGASRRRAGRGPAAPAASAANTTGSSPA